MQQFSTPNPVQALVRVIVLTQLLVLARLVNARKHLYGDDARLIQV